MDYELGYDLDEALKREGMSKKDIDAIRSPKIYGVPETITDKQLALFLNACGSVAEARKVIKIYYEARQNSPEFFKVRDPDMDSVQQCLQAQDYCLLPITPAGHLVIYHNLSDSKASSYTFDHAVKTYFMTIDLCLFKLGPRSGIIFVFDMKNVGIAHLARLRISSLKKFFHYLQDALPAKLSAIHVLNSYSLVDKMLAITKPFMKAELLQMLHFHTSSMDYEKFYDEVLPRHCLPSNYGGSLKSVNELHQDTIKEFIKHKQYFIAECNQRSSCEIDNSKQIISKFSKLDID